MAYQDIRLGEALGWKFNHQSGITTRDGMLTAFPGTRPTDTEQAQYVSEYVVYLASVQHKDDVLGRILASNDMRLIRALAEVGIDKGLWTLAEIKAKYRGL